MTAVFLIAAMLLLVSSGVGRRRLAWRDKRCPACGRPRSSCTCYWL